MIKTISAEPDCAELGNLHMDYHGLPWPEITKHEAKLKRNKVTIKFVIHYNHQKVIGSNKAQN